MLTVLEKHNSLFKYKWLNKLILFICIKNYARFSIITNFAQKQR